MPVKMRLQRKGKKGQAFYHIVIADGRAPRDGKFVELIGTYNPLTIPASIELDHDKAVKWVENGATPTETVRAILKYKGVIYKIHLNKGVKKGALTQEQADAKFQSWLLEKESKIKTKGNQHDQKQKTEMKKRLEAEAKVKENRAKAIETKLAKAQKQNEAPETTNEEA